MDGKLVAAIGIVVALAVALVLALTLGGDDTVALPSTTTLATTTTVAPTTTLPPTTTAPTTVPPSTTSAPPTTVDPEVRRQQIEELVQATEVAGWLATYERDVQALADLSANQEILDGFVFFAFEEFSPDDFTAAPSTENVFVTVHEVLEDRADCLAVDWTIDVSNLIPGLTTSRTVGVYWPTAEGGLKVVQTYGEGTPRDLWIGDCDLAVRDLELEIPDL